MKKKLFFQGLKSNAEKLQWLFGLYQRLPQVSVIMWTFRVFWIKDQREYEFEFESDAVFSIELLLFIGLIGLNLKKLKMKQNVNLLGIPPQNYCFVQLLCFDSGTLLTFTSLWISSKCILWAFFEHFLNIL